MAKLLHNTVETLLKCHECDIIFRHEESDRAREYSVSKQMWDSPCCHRRYSFSSVTALEGDNVHNVSVVITHGYRDRKSRDNQQALNIKSPNGIQWADGQISQPRKDTHG